jgi:hypothetical protein
MKLPKRLPYELVIVAGLLLGSCGQNATRRFTEGDYDRLDVADANARNAIARIAELESRVEELEHRLK